MLIFYHIIACYIRFFDNSHHHYGHNRIKGAKCPYFRQFFCVPIKKDFALDGTANVHIQGVGGRTVKNLRCANWKFCPKIAIFGIGTKDLSLAQHEVVGSSIDNLFRHLLHHYSLHCCLISCHSIPMQPEALLPHSQVY